MERIDDVVRTIRPLMSGFAAPWCVAGGWALDLFLGQVTRPHADVELAIFRKDQSLLHRHFHDWTFEKIVCGHRREWSETEWLDLPVHEIHARSKDDPSLTMEFLLNERDVDNWIFRRRPSIKLTLDRAISRSDAGLPVLSPEVVLLFKAKLPRTKDECDFRSACETMNAARRQWLRESLAACYPRHPWIELLAATAGGNALGGVTG